MEPKPNYRRRVKADRGWAEIASDVGKIRTDDLWDMLETNLQRLTTAWDGGMSQRDREQRLRLCSAITKEIRMRGVQLRIQF